jgi:hypothetical protein
MDERKHPFTVIGFYDATREIFCHHVMAGSPLNAFAVAAAKCAEGAEMVAVLPGHLTEGKDLIAFPGEALVDSDSVLEHSEVFGSPSQD